MKRTLIAHFPAGSIIMIKLIGVSVLWASIIARPSTGGRLADS